MSLASSGERQKKEETLVIWDFDWTIANCNSDEYVPACFLGIDTVQKRFEELYSAGIDWHSCVEIQMKDAGAGVANHGDYCDVVRHAASCMPYLEDVRRTLEELSCCGDDGCREGQQRAIEQAIVSDGNDLFIRSFLEGNDMLHLLSAGIVSNSAFFVTADNHSDESKQSLSSPAVRVLPCFGAGKYRFPNPHQCSRCPPNLCKSHVLQYLLSSKYNAENHQSSSSQSPSTNKPRIVYIGDGGNDACPALEILTQNDFLFARTGHVPDADPKQWRGKQSDESYCEHQPINKHHQRRCFRLVPTLENVAKREGKTTKAKMYSWSTGKELYDLVAQHILQQ